MSDEVAAELSFNRLMNLLHAPCETAHLDFKETLDLAQCRDRVELAKDVLAMANSGGGDIVVGVEDATRRRVGIDEKVAASLRDAKIVNDQLRRYCGGYISVLVARYEIPDQARSSVRVALIHVPAAPAKVPAQDDGVYPDPSNPKKQKWVFRRGDVYVRKADQSTKVETPEDLQLVRAGFEISMEAAREIVQTYTQRLEAYLIRALPPLLANEGPHEMCGQSLIRTLLASRDVLLLGPSGSGKSIHLKHACLTALRENELPLLAVGGRYKGEDLFQFVEHAIAPFSTEDAETFFKATSVCGMRVVLMFDGLNECQPYLEDFAREIQAFRLRCASRLLLASQTDLLDKLGFDCERIFIAPLTAPQKRFIYCYHARIAQTTEVDYLCQSFSNGYDLRVAGQCHDPRSANFTRVELYDRYCRDSLPQSGATVLTALLRDIAGRMGHEVTNFWPRDDFERHAEGFLSAQTASLTHLDQLKSCRLVSLTDDIFSFEHDLLLDYFRAEQVRRDLVSPDQLALELAKPKNQSLIPFLLPRYTEGSSLRALLRAVLQPEALREVLLGRCGEAPRQALIANCKELFSAAASDLTEVTLNFSDEKPEPARLSLLSLTLHSPRAWMPYEVLLCDAIAISLDDHELQKGFIELLDLTQWTLREKAQEIAHRSAMPFNSIWAVVVGQLVFSSHQLPFLRITASLQQSLMRARRQGTFTLQDQLLARINRDPTDHFSLAVLLDGLTYCQPDARDIDESVLNSVGGERRLEAFYATCSTTC